MSNPRELRTLVDAIAYIVVLRREIKKLRRMNTRLVEAKGVCPATQPQYQQSIDTVISLSPEIFGNIIGDTDNL